MALVTTCPHCGTSFRIVADQLKLRDGLVRCGSCLAVFSGLEKMARVDDTAAGAATGEDVGAPTGEDVGAATNEAGSAATDEPDGAWDDDGPLPGQTERRARLPDLPPAEEIPSFGMPAAATPIDPVVRRTPPPLDTDDDGRAHISEADRAAFEQAKAERAERAREDRRVESRAIDTETRAVDIEAIATDTERPAIVTDSDAEVAIGDEEMAIDYFSADERRRGFVGQHAFLKLATAGVLVVALVVQAVLANRDWLAARLPALETAITAIAAPFGLTIAPPRSIGALSIESFELQTDTSSELLAVSAIIHNSARHPVRWPSMMLTLTDTQNRVLVRKAIDPVDYLSASTDAALRPNSERPIRLALEARDIRPAGYSVLLFYR